LNVRMSTISPKLLGKQRVIKHTIEGVNMRVSKSTITVLLYTLLLSTIAFGQVQSEPNGLDQTEPMMKGHMVALYFGHLLDSFDNIVEYNAPIMVSYSEEENKIELEILGSKTTIDKAKTSTDRFRGELLMITLEAINEHFGLSLSEKDIIITYINKEGPSKMLEYRDGNYTIG